ncbi:hypothetical protein KAW18_11380 [candidate division WOR-3 bacterium]|nr:hypothetical protein [candidate division WOR-3 bacterium]MCK4527962.1 hypothetical protein [candidate division WOR-3 bacterium]
MKEERVQILKEMFEETKNEYQEVMKELDPLLERRKELEDKLIHLDALLRDEGYEVSRESHKETLGLFGESIISGEEARHQIVKILKNAPGGMHYRKIYKKLEKRGYKMKGKDPAINLIAHMSNDKKERFESSGKGIWQLKDKV